MKNKKTVKAASLGLALLLACSLILFPATANAEGTIFDPTVPGDGFYSSTGMTEQEFLEWFYSDSDDGYPSGNNSHISTPKSSLLALDKLNKLYAGVGKFMQKGMEKADYSAALEGEWEPAEASGEAAKTSLSLTAATYESCLDALLDAAKYPDTVLYAIGKSAEDTPIHALVIGNTQNEAAKYKLVIGGLDGADTAGPLFVLRQAIDLQKGGAIDADTVWIIIPTADPDGLQAALAGGKATAAEGEPIDLAADFPTRFASFVKEGEEGERKDGNLGANSSTRALMRLVEQYKDKLDAILIYETGKRGITAYGAEDEGLAQKCADRLTNTYADYPITEEAALAGSFAAYCSEIRQGYAFDSDSGRLKELPQDAAKAVPNKAAAHETAAADETPLPHYAMVRISIGGNMHSPTQRLLEYHRANFSGFLRDMGAWE